MTFLIGYPVNPIIEAAAAADIRTIIVRQERMGLHMADAVSRISSGEQIGVFAMQHAPGTENAFGGVAQAYADSVPIVVLSAGYPRRLITVPPNFNAFLSFQHVTKSVEQVTLAAEVPAALRRAFTQVRNGRPGPVLVEVPTDVLREEIPEQRSGVGGTTTIADCALQRVRRVGGRQPAGGQRHRARARVSLSAGPRPCAAACWSVPIVLPCGCSRSRPLCGHWARTRAVDLC